MRRWQDADALAEAVFDACGGEVRLALPLGLGKPVNIVDGLVRAAAADPARRLQIFTALTLEPPDEGEEVRDRFLGPARERLFGNYRAPSYARMLREGSLPPNIEIREFFLLAGRWIGVEPAQRNYIAANYTHARDVLLDRRPNVLAQLLAEEDGRLSLSCNTDISADLFDFRRRGEADFIALAEIHPDLPFLDAGAGEIGADEFAHRLDPPEQRALFAAPRRPVGPQTHAIGLHTARLVPDGGTLQIGIGALGDAIGHALLLRHDGRGRAIQEACPFPSQAPPGEPFETGIYGLTEMLTEGLFRLFEAGIVRREVSGAAIHAGFFVESRDFYRRLRALPEDKRARIAMMPVSFTNALYGDEAAKRAARRDARFVNVTMQVSLLGDAMSDTLPGGQVVSGIGGQFNFVDQAFALSGARSILTLPASRMKDGRPVSNIRWNVATVSIPRHLRDIVVTEYGAADLRGKTDAEVIAALLNIADSRFQEELRQEAVAAGKLPPDHRIPQAHRNNTPQALDGWLLPHRSALPDFPFGSDFTEIEQTILPALERLGDLGKSRWGQARLLASACFNPAHPDETRAMERMGWSEGVSLTALAFRGALRMVAREGWHVGG
ncbi:Acyl-CoA hydrolase [Cribrihabitans marinus]|uniref:Acyl-CoA hydrolase n=1 Tax=Cribrihabitans marinus TaxID=1227549 RepID=A0A1H7D2C6_9RHOB|nr:acetyl-CoA hydrolase/transferase C-terminal domain-containing protein [Cribrihabitans marinus]GGH37627.1 hypothetical protein GCM10010973_32280 [Cribrihabitans marinus]SEJ96048.1 Acyl-CoA hydrolase [Cribrihabitans marinus]